MAKIWYSDRGKIVDTYASRNKKLIKNYFPAGAFCKPISQVQYFLQMVDFLIAGHICSCCQAQKIAKIGRVSLLFIPRYLV